MSGRTQKPIGEDRSSREPARNPTLRSTLFEAACDAAMEAEVEAVIERALEPYAGDPEPPMIGFLQPTSDAPIDCENCIVCRTLDAEYGTPERVPLPDGSVLEIRRRRDHLAA